MTPLLLPLWCEPTLDSFSSTTARIRGNCRVASRATDRPTTPPPITTMSYRSFMFGAGVPACQLPPYLVFRCLAHSGALLCLSPHCFCALLFRAAATPTSQHKRKTGCLRKDLRTRRKKSKRVELWELETRTRLANDPRLTIEDQRPTDQ